MLQHNFEPCMNVIMFIIYTESRGFLLVSPWTFPLSLITPGVPHTDQLNIPAVVIHLRTKGAQSVTITEQSTCKIYKSNRLMPGHYSKAISVSLQKVDYTTSPSNGQEQINGGHMANCLHCCPITNLWTQLRVRISEVGFLLESVDWTRNKSPLSTSIVCIYRCLHWLGLNVS